MSIFLEKVVPTTGQIKQLYSQLESRVHSISHTCLPSFDKHSHFVENNPYRAWYLIKQEDIDLGNVYVQFDNSVGLHSREPFTSGQLKEVLRLLYDEIEPLEAIPSVRFRDFFLNVASSNIDLQEKLVAIGYLETQRSYVFPKS